MYTELAKKAYNKYNNEGASGLCRLVLFRVPYFNPLINTIYRELYSRTVLSGGELFDRYGVLKLPQESEFSINVGSISKLPENFYKFNGYYCPEPYKIFKIHDPALIGDKAMIFTPTGEPVSEITNNPERIIPKQQKQLLGGDYSFWKLILFTHSNVKSHINHSIFPLIGRGSHNYYHWLIEYLPKVRVLKYYEKEHNHSLTPLIQTDPPRWMEETLEAVDINPNECIQWCGKSSTVEELVFSSHRMQLGGQFGICDPSLDDIRWLRETLSGDLNIQTDTVPDSRIYISRQKADRRKIKNFDEVMDTLNEYGFDDYILEDMSFKEQVQLFSNAKYIVAPHGAGLANLSFAPHNSNILELLTTEKNSSHYFRLSKLLGINYNYMICGGTSSKYTDSFKVDNGEFKKEINKLIK